MERQQKVVHSANALAISYDKLVLATGSFPFVPPIKGKDTAGTFFIARLKT
nr:FAD-dependent oxidoreductase [Synechocystis sp. PCC 7509]